MAGICLDQYETPKSSTNRCLSTPILKELVMLLILTMYKMVDKLIKKIIMIFNVIFLLKRLIMLFV